MGATALKGQAQRFIAMHHSPMLHYSIGRVNAAFVTFCRSMDKFMKLIQKIWMIGGGSVAPIATIGRFNFQRAASADRFANKNHLRTGANTMATKKTFTFACVHFTVAFSVAWAISGSVFVGGAIALVEPAINTVAYFFHEKVWARAQSGRVAACA